MLYAITGTAYSTGGHKYAVNAHNTGLTYEVIMVGQNTPPKGEIVTVWVYSHQPEQGPWQTYGFLDRETKAMFEELLVVPGCGPSRAAVILHHMTTEQVATAIAIKDQTGFEKVPTIGPKTAKAIIAHLEDKFPKRLGFSPDSSVTDQAISALMVLGYPAQQARNMVANVPLYGKFTNTSELVRAALNEFNGKK